MPPRLIIATAFAAMFAMNAAAHDSGHPEEVNKWLGSLLDKKGRACCSGPSLNSHHHAEGWAMNGGKPEPSAPPQSFAPMDPADPYGGDGGFADVDGDCKPTTIKVVRLPDGTVTSVVWNFITKKWDLYDQDKVVADPPAPAGEHRAWACINDGRFSLTPRGHIYCVVPSKEGI